MGEVPPSASFCPRRARRAICGVYAMPEKFAVIGDGAWGTAIAVLLAQDSNYRVCLWSAREENARILREKRENVRLLPGVPIPAAVELTTDAANTIASA